MNKLCVIGVYFGKLPNYFRLWVNSCEHNPTIDFLLFTDQQINEVPNNVIVEKITLEKMKKLALENLGLKKVSLDEPYKCCDFKAVYGLIFKDYIASYDYWGHCDFDLIFGDLQYYFDRYNLYSYDKFLTLGHLSMYRNTDEVKMRYKEDGARVSYDVAFTTSKSCVFDEFAGMLGIYDKHKYAMFKERVFADITPIYRRFRLSEVEMYGKRDRNYNYQLFYWKEGKVYRDYFLDEKDKKTEEFMYIHFRSRANFQVDDEVLRANKFFITPFGFVPSFAETTIEDVNNLNPYSSSREKMEKFLNDVGYNLLCHRMKKVKKMIKKMMSFR